MMLLSQIVVNVKVSQELERKVADSLDKLERSSQQAFEALERMATGLEFYSRVQTILLCVLVVFAILVLVILLVRDRQTRRMISSAWRRLRGHA